jgi:hypothetical protein
MSGIALSSRHRHDRRPVPRRGPLLLALLLVGLVGCQAAPQASQGETPSQTTPAAATDALDPTPSPPADEDVVARAVAWLIGLGPGSAEGPPEVTAYRQLRKHSQDSCREVLKSDLSETTETLYHGAAAACLAALHGRSQRWAEAEAAYDALGGPPEGCLDRATYDLLRSVVQAHREDPAATFRVARSSTVALRCPVIEGLTVTRDASGALEIDVSGDRLGQVKDVGVRFVSDCSSVAPEFGQAATDVTGDRRSLQARVAADEAPEDATLLWVGLVAEPEPWIADHECVPIAGSVDPGDDASPSAAP